MSAICFNLDQSKILSSGNELSSIFSITYHVILSTKMKFHLIHFHTIPHFDALKIYSCGKHCEKRRNCLEQAISPFLTMFSTLYGTYFPFYMHFKISSAICFNLDQSKILSSCNGLINHIYFVITKCFVFVKSSNCVV